MSQPKSITVELMVNDVDRAIDFYHHILGFSLVANEKENGTTEWAKMELDGFYVSFKQEKKLKHEIAFMSEVSIGGSLNMCIEVHDLNGHYARISKKCKIIGHPHITPCGATQFALKDIDGYVITFAQF